MSEIIGVLEGYEILIDHGQEGRSCRLKIRGEWYKCFQCPEQLLVTGVVTGIYTLPLQECWELTIACNAWFIQDQASITSNRGILATLTNAKLHTLNGVTPDQFDGEELTENMQAKVSLKFGGCNFDYSCKLHELTGFELGTVHNMFFNK